MATKCININTNFYKALKKLDFSFDEIAQVTDKLEQEKFNKWYGNAERDSFGQPKLHKELYITNDKGETITLNDLLNDEFHNKRQNYSADLSIQDKISKFLEESQIGITKRISAYKDSDYAKRLQDLLEKLDALDKNDFLKALEKHAEYIQDTLEDFELRFYNHDKTRTDKLPKDQQKARNEKFKNFLVHANNFLNTFSKVRNLELPNNTQSREYEIIKQVKDLESRVGELQNRVNAETESAVRDRLESLISNPDVRNGVVDFLAAQTDENKVQYFLDALGDSHITFVAAIEKFYRKNMWAKDLEVREKRKEFKALVDKFGAGWDGFINRILEHNQEGKPTGKFTQEYDQAYYDVLFDFISKRHAIKDKTSIEYQENENKYFAWRKDNTEQKFVKEYYEALNALIPEARAAKEEIDILKHKILSKGVSHLTAEDYDELKNLQDKMNELKSSYVNETKKTGKNLEIANSLIKYSKAMSKFYETTGTKAGYEEAKKEAEEKGGEELETWLKNNTVETFSDQFWKWFETMIAKMPKSDALDAINNEIKQLLITYRNEKGEIKVEDLPVKVREELEKLEIRKISARESTNKTLSLVQRKKLQQEFYQHIKFERTDEYLKIYNEKRRQLEAKEITESEWNAWFAKNHETNEYTGEINPKSIWTIMKPKNAKHIVHQPNAFWRITNIKPQFFNPNFKLDDAGYAVPTSNWRNKNYDALSNDDKKGLNEIKKLLLYLVEHTKGDIIKKGYLPAIPSQYGKYEKKNFPDKAITESDEIVRFIPFKYISLLNQQSLPKTGSGATEEENKKIEEERNKVAAENRKAHADSVNYDLKETINRFIDIALTHKYKSAIETDMMLFREQMKHQKVKVTDAQGKPIFDKFKSAVRGQKTEYEVTAIGSNMQRHFEEWLEGVFYEQFEKDEGWLSNWSDKVQNFTSLRNLGFNVLSTVNNSTVGNIQNRLEAAGGRYFNSKHYRKANKQYAGSIHHFIANHDKNTSNNFYDAYFKFWDIMISQDELANKPTGKFATLMYKLRWVKDKAFIGMHIGEHQIQNTSLLAMSHAHRIIDGKIITLSEYYESKAAKIDYGRKMTDEQIKQAYTDIENNINLKQALVKEFESYPSVFDSFELEEGRVKAKKDIQLNEDEIFNFRQRVIGINQNLNGIYNIEDAAIIQRWALGRLSMQFRKWMRPAWNKRFGRKFFKKSYNEKIRDWEEGMYVSTFRFLTQPFTDNYKELKNQEKEAAYIAYMTLANGFKEFFSNMKLRWHSLSEIEKANVKRTGLEFLFLVSVIAIGFAVKNMKGDDDDKFLTWALYQADRLFGELSTFTPVGIVREGNRLFKNPSAVFNTFEDITKLSFAIIAYPFRDEESRTFKSGIYHGEDKISIYTKDLLPVYTQFQRLIYMNENTQRYGMFR